ncbi:hypothetical protein [Ancylobacter radicis]|uniref:hypothetical protein n=1 Tax=Ancylobacter radicis TaxID=2836179 RepID=UPI002022D43B|nr:hypothetical protein [Ancylobacter radicis]
MAVLSKSVGGASEFLGTQQRGHEIQGEGERDAAAEDKVKHGLSSCREAGIGRHQNEEPDGDGEVDEIQHVPASWLSCRLI